MYDKSKKTWSQRLKIHKNEKSQATSNVDSSNSSNNNNNHTTSIATTATHHSQQSLATTATKIPHNIEATLKVAAHNVNSTSSSSSRSSMQQYQIAPTAIMHLPTLSDYHASGAGSTYEYMPNHMGRSMKYAAEPWIYGTVRGIPTRPAGIYHPAYTHYAAHPHAATIFAAPTTELVAGATATAAVAVVLCSCHEYLSGTKGRTLKKPSICKKCKGTRLPLHNIGGTVRLPTNLPSPKLRPVGAASTVRVVSSSKKMRPTILDPQKDPYDLMRRTRLLSPEPGGSNGGGAGVSSSDKTRQRGKSASPVRGRSRTRHHKVLVPSTNTKESSKTLETFDDTWLTESEDLAHTASSSSAAAAASSSSSRRSILRCNVNPYDLISINNQASGHSSQKTQSSVQDINKKSNRKQKLQFSQNEFMPPNDDFNVQDAALTEEDPPFVQRSTKIKVETSKPDTSKKLIEEPPPPSPLAANSGSPSKKPNYINVQAIAGQRISLGEEQQAPKSLMQQTADGTTTYESFAIETETPKKDKEVEKSNKTRPDSLQVPLGEPKRPPRVAKQSSVSEDTKEVTNKDIAEEEEEPTVTVTVTPTYNIKSILKRPTSKTSDNGDLKQNDSTNNRSSPSTPSKSRESGSGSKSSTPTNSRRNQVTINSPSANSQFYIPLPQARKKVQFLVEDLDLTGSEDQDDEDSYYDNTSSSPSPDLKANYEYFNKKRNLKKLINVNEPQEEHNSEDSEENEIITYDEQFIQAMLLEKLQLDSELVTKRNHNNNQDIEENEDTNEGAAAVANHKTDYEDVMGEQNKLHYKQQQDDIPNELECQLWQMEEEQEEQYDKHYINENLGKTKTSTNNQATTFQSSKPQSLEQNMKTHDSYSNSNINFKNDDIDNSKSLSSNKLNSEGVADKEGNIIIITSTTSGDDGGVGDFEEFDDANNNVSTNSASDDVPYKNITFTTSTTTTDADDDEVGDDVNDQHLLPDVIFSVLTTDEYAMDNDMPPQTCHRNNNNHSQNDDNDAIDDDIVNISTSQSPTSSSSSSAASSTSLSPVSKVQHNGELLVIVIMCYLV